MEFLNSSQQASIAEEVSREAARQRELVQARQMAEAQQLRLEQWLAYKEANAMIQFETTSGRPRSIESKMTSQLKRDPLPALLRCRHRVSVR